MSKHLTALAAGGAIAVGLAAAPALYAQDDLTSAHGSMMGEGMMGSMMSGMMNMMGSMMSGMMNMMGMSDDMGGMMEHCSAMMQAIDDHGAQRPNEQWRDRQPEQPQSEGDAG